MGLFVSLGYLNDDKVNVTLGLRLPNVDGVVLFTGTNKEVGIIFL